MRIRVPVHILLADPRRQDALDLSQAWRLIDGEERIRARRLRSPEHQQTFVVAHALLRCALAQQTGTAPEDLRFRRTDAGRPELVGPAAAGAGAVCFNLSHTGGLVGCAVCQTSHSGSGARLDSGFALGFDVEQVRSPAPLDVADRFFSADELAGLRAVPAAEREQRFYLLWTLKESYLKARGLGLRLPLASFTVDPRARGRAGLRVRVGAGDGAGEGAVPSWTLRWWRIGNTSDGGHWAALAAGAPASALRVTVAADRRIAALAR